MGTSRALGADCRQRLCTNIRECFVFATGFSNPRGLKWGPDGNLYVAEGGTGGQLPPPSTCDQVPPPVGPYSGGFTARISKVTANGTRTTLVDHLPSTSAAIGDVEGVADIAFLGDQMYALMAGGGCSHGHPNFANWILKVNADGTPLESVTLDSGCVAHGTRRSFLFSLPSVLLTSRNARCLFAERSSHRLRQVRDRALLLRRCRGLLDVLLSRPSLIGARHQHCPLVMRFG
jgi:hypothetical protein